MANIVYNIVHNIVIL